MNNSIIGSLWGNPLLIIDLLKNNLRSITRLFDSGLWLHVSTGCSVRKSGYSCDILIDSAVLEKYSLFKNNKNVSDPIDFIQEFLVMV